MPVLGVLETCLYARDLPALAAFYREGLGLEVVRASDEFVFLAAGRSMLLLFDPERARAKDDPPPHGGVPGGVHVAFEVDDLEAGRARLAARGAAVVGEARWPLGGRSLYARDPEGNLVELVAGKIWPVQ